MGQQPLKQAVQYMSKSTGYGPGCLGCLHYHAEGYGLGWLHSCLSVLLAVLVWVHYVLMCTTGCTGVTSFVLKCITGCTGVASFMLKCIPCLNQFWFGIIFYTKPNTVHLNIIK